MALIILHHASTNTTYPLLWFPRAWRSIITAKAVLNSRNIWENNARSLPCKRMYYSQWKKNNQLTINGIVLCSRPHKKPDSDIFPSPGVQEWSGGGQGLSGAAWRGAASQCRVTNRLSLNTQYLPGRGINKIGHFWTLTLSIVKIKTENAQIKVFGSGNCLVISVHHPRIHSSDIYKDLRGTCGTSWASFIKCAGKFLFVSKQDEWTKILLEPQPTNNDSPALALQGGERGGGSFIGGGVSSIFMFVSPLISYLSFF